MKECTSASVAKTLSSQFFGHFKFQGNIVCVPWARCQGTYKQPIVTFHHAQPLLHLSCLSQCVERSLTQSWEHILLSALQHLNGSMHCNKACVLCTFRITSNRQILINQASSPRDSCGQLQMPQQLFQLPVCHPLLIKFVAGIHVSDSVPLYAAAVSWRSNKWPRLWCAKSIKMFWVFACKTV